MLGSVFGFGGFGLGVVRVVVRVVESRSGCGAYFLIGLRRFRRRGILRPC